MAIIRTLAPGVTNSKRHPSEVDAEYRVISDAAGTLFQISTFGSPTRKSGPKVSQTLQFDEAMAIEIFNAIRATFPKLDHF